MKNSRLLSVLALVAGMLTASQENVMAANPVLLSSEDKSQNIQADCGCVESYASLTETKSYAQGVKVDMSTNGSTVTYRVYRNEAGSNNPTQIGNLKVDGKPQGGASTNVYTVSKPLTALKTCDVQTTTLVVTGATGPPVNIRLEYVNRPLCSTNTTTTPTTSTETACTSYNYETAFGGSGKGTGKAWWYYYTTGSGQQPIYAGQNTQAGHVTIDASGNFTIHLMNGWELKTNETESVKIQAYNTLPGSRPAAGKFTSYKGSSLSGNAGVGTYYVVHLDLQHCANKK